MSYIRSRGLLLYELFAYEENKVRKTETRKEQIRI